MVCNAEVLMGLECDRSPYRGLGLQVMRLESYCVVSNRTGIPLQLLQCHRGVTAETYDDGAGGGTLVDGGKAGLPRRTQDTPVQPGLQAAIRDPGVDWTSCMDIPIGNPLLRNPDLALRRSAEKLGPRMLPPGQSWQGRKNPDGGLYLVCASLQSAFHLPGIMEMCVS